jgi:hypothetical protein
MNASKVAIHEVQQYRVLKVFNLFAEAIGQAGKAAHGHAHGDILPLDIAGGIVLADRCGIDAPLLCPNEF